MRSVTSLELLATATGASCVAWCLAADGGASPRRNSSNVSRTGSQYFQSTDPPCSNAAASQGLQNEHGRLSTARSGASRYV
jgi:hypothetical protein